MKDRIVIATRESKLALWQADFIREKLLEIQPGISVDLLGMTTRGDRWLDSPLSEVGGKGLFIKDLEEAMLSGRADVAVHSMKDVPALLPDGFVLPLIGFRADARDALVVTGGKKLEELPEGARVGSSSLRRKAMLLAVRPDLRLLPVRGNVGTRLAKLDAGDYDALVLAAAGLERLNLADRITETLAIEVMLPAAGQGALGVECRADDTRLIEILEQLVDLEVAECVIAERTVSAALGADCSAPLGAHARRGPKGIHLEALLSSADGGRRLRGQSDGLEPESLGRAVAAQLKDQGAVELLESLDASSGVP